MFNPYSQHRGGEMKKETVQHRVNCLLTRSQYDAIKGAADRQGLSLSAFMRLAAIQAAKGADA
jgi:uncharacterized protein (DUF1778 family)